MKTTFFLNLVSAFLLCSCAEPPCDPTGEPYAQLRINNFQLSSDSVYKKAYLLNSRRPEIAYPIGGELDSLPLSVASDTTIYVFESPSHRDTVGLTYRRNVAFQESECGFTLTLDKFRVLSLTTAKSVNMDVQLREGGGMYSDPHQTKYNLYIKP